MTTPTDGAIARFSHWIRQRPNAIEFWELVLTEERLVWCFVGHSFRSLLLRADVGERDRSIVADHPLDELESLAVPNFGVPIGSLEEIRLVTGTRLRRARLEIAWVGEEDGRERWSLYSTRDAPDHRDRLEELAGDPRLSHVEVSVDTPGIPFR